MAYNTYKVYESSEYATGLKPARIDVRDYTIARAVGGLNFPREYRLDTVPVKQQGFVPSCAAFAGSEIVEMFNQSQHGEYTQFSTNFIYGCRPDGTYQGDGMYLHDVCDILLNKGDAFYTDMPGNSQIAMAKKVFDNANDNLLVRAYLNRVSSYFRIMSVEEAKYAILNHGPILASIDIYNRYYLDEYYIYRPDKESGVSSPHAVVIYGWNELGWLVQNSWGILWGDGGRFIVPFTFGINEMYGFTDDIVEEFKKPYKSWLGKIFATIANFIINQFRRKQ